MILATDNRQISETTKGKWEKNAPGNADHFCPRSVCYKMPLCRAFGSSLRTPRVIPHKAEGMRPSRIIPLGGGGQFQGSKGRDPYYFSFADILTQSWRTNLVLSQRKLSPSGGVLRNGGIIRNGGWPNRTTVYMPSVNDFCRFFVLRKPRTKLLNFFIHVSFLPKDPPG